MTPRIQVAMAVAALAVGMVLIAYVNWPIETSAGLAQANRQDAPREPAMAEAPRLAGNETVSPKSEAAKPAIAPAPQSPPATEPAKPAPPPAPLAGAAPQVLYDLNLLPKDIKSTLEDIIVAAQSGNIDDMLPVLQQNELPPMLSAAAVPDPIAFWKKSSADGQGRDVLAAMLNVFSSGFVRKGSGKGVMYIWPYFAEIDLRTLTPAQEVELYRLMPAAQALAMKESGKYTYYRAGIGSDGVWHYFMQ